MVEERDKIDLTKFCSRDHSNRSQPFSRGKWTYATNGHICIRVPRLTNVPERLGTPDARKIYAKADRLGPYKWVGVPKVDITTFKCDRCDGTGKLDGDTERVYTCEECKGSGRVKESKPIRFLLGSRPGYAIYLNNIYLNLIRRELPNAELGLIKEASSTGIVTRTDFRPVKIRFDGGEGILMPVKI